MVISDLTLTEFICPISICQPETDLASILKIFQQTNCQSVAIAKPAQEWGLVTAHRLLSLLSKSWQPVSPVGLSYHHEQNPVDRSPLMTTAIKNLDSLIETATVYRVDTAIAELLTFVTQNNATVEHCPCLLIDSGGQLQGQLDRNKLLQYCASELWSKSAATISSDSQSNSPINFLEGLSIPLKIADSSGQTLYLNPAWQTLISKIEKQPPTVKTQKTLSRWWNKSPVNDRQPEYSSVKLAPELPLAGDRCVLSCGIDNPYPQLREELPQEIQIEVGDRWHYLKLPTILATEQLFEEQAIPCWLILAINPTVLDRLTTLGATSLQPNVERLLLGISHELKSPLTGIVGLSSLLKEEKLGSLNQRQSMYLRLIHSSGQKLMKIANNLLELTNSITGKLELKPETIDLRSLCYQTYRQAIARLTAEPNLEFPSAAENLPLELEIEPGAEVAIADSARLANVLFHLMLEVIEVAQPSQHRRLNMMIKRSNQTTILQVINQGQASAKTTSTEETPTQLQQSDGLNFMLAQYLAQIIQGNIQSIYTDNSCQFKLEIPTNQSLPSPVPSSSTSGIAPQSNQISSNLTILCLYPEPEAIDSQLESPQSLAFNLKHWAEQDWSNKHRIIEADGLLQAHTLARIWELDVILLDGHQIADPQQYLRSLQNSEYLSTLPIVTLDTKTTEAANQIEGLNVYPCLLPAECRSFKDLMQVIQIATGT